MPNVRIKGRRYASRLFDGLGELKLLFTNNVAFKNITFFAINNS